MNKNAIAAAFLNERERQLRVRTIEHDKTHVEDELARAAAAYALPIQYDVSDIWPEDWSFKKSSGKNSQDRIRDLIKAGALLMAEIERLTKDTK